MHNVLNTLTNFAANSNLYSGAGLPNNNASQDEIGNILSIVFSVAASIALLMVIINGFRYVIARGDPNSVAQARKGILYSVIGLVVTLAALSIVTFAVNGVAR